MITLKQRTGFKAGIYSTAALVFALMCIQTNQLCAQNNNNQSSNFLQSRLQKLKQEHSNKSTEAFATKRDVTSAKKNSTRSEHTYTFTGKGSWFTASNWQNNSIPPAQLKSGDHIVINGSGACVLNNAKPVLFSEGSSIEVGPGKQLYISNANNFILNNGMLTNNGKITVLSGTLLQKSSSSNNSNKTGVVKTTSMSKVGYRRLSTGKEKQ